MAVDLAKLSEKDLAKLRSDIEKELKSREKTKIVEARKAAEDAAKKHGFSLNDLLGAKKASAKKPAAPPKYKNPADPSQTWSGRGRQPQWYKDAVKAGKSAKSLAI